MDDRAEKHDGLLHVRAPRRRATGGAAELEGFVLQRSRRPARKLKRLEARAAPRCASRHDCGSLGCKLAGGLDRLVSWRFRRRRRRLCLRARRLRDLATCARPIAHDGHGRRLGHAVHGLLIWPIRRSIDIARLWPFMAGAAFAIPAGVALLSHTRPEIIRSAIGGFLVAYGLYALA